MEMFEKFVLGVAVFIFRKLFLGKIIAALSGVCTVFFIYQVVDFLTSSHDAALISSVVSGSLVFYYLMVPKFLRDVAIKSISGKVRVKDR